MMWMAHRDITASLVTAVFRPAGESAALKRTDPANCKFGRKILGHYHDPGSVRLVWPA